MLRYISILILSSALLFAQTPVVPAGLIYQAAAQQGIDYISPISGQAIINQAAALNWKTILGSVLADGSIGILTAGLSGVISIAKPIEVGLAVGHAYYDHTIQPILAAGSPNPGNIPPVLQLTDSVAPTATNCTENSMFAVSAQMAAKKKMAKSPARANALIGGLSVTFTAQGVQVLKNISGKVITAFQVFDVVACVPAESLPLKHLTGFLQAEETAYLSPVSYSDTKTILEQFHIRLWE